MVCRGDGCRGEQGDTGDEQEQRTRRISRGLDHAAGVQTPPSYLSSPSAKKKKRELPGHLLPGGLGQAGSPGAVSMLGHRERGK